jgi:hypothetical protein
MMMVDDYFLMLEFVLVKTMFRLLSHHDENNLMLLFSAANEKNFQT